MVRPPLVPFRIPLLVMTFLVPTAGAARAEAPPTRPKIGLVLSGGGARGGAHVGILKVLEELRVPVDFVTGTSMGALVGGLYCSGLSPEEMEAEFAAVDWGNILSDPPERRERKFRRKEEDRLALFPMELGVGKDGMSQPEGLLLGRKIEALLGKLSVHTVAIDSFDGLRIPFRAVATDLDTGEAVILDRGSLADAMRASISIPGIFAPVELDGRVLVDGGIVDNLPVDLAQWLGAERIIAVDVGTPPRGTSERLSPFGVLGQTMGLLTEVNVKKQRSHLGPADLLITPNLDQVSTGSFEQIDDAIAAGEAAARAVADQLRKFSVSEPEYQEYLARQRWPRAEREEAARVASVTVRGIEPADRDWLPAHLQSKPGILDRTALQRDSDYIYRSGEYEDVRFRLEPDAEGNRLAFEARDRSWGPGYLRFGIGVETSFDGNSEFRALAHYRRPRIGPLGAEWRALAGIGNPSGFATEFYQPLHARGIWFVAPVARYEQERDTVFLDSGEREELDSRRLDGGIDFGAEIGSVAEIRAGVLFGRRDIDAITSANLDPVNVDTGAYTFKAEMDTLDSPFFPTHGSSVRFDALLSREDLGADVPFDRISLRGVQVGRIGRNILFGTLDLGTDLGSELPPYEQFELGGFLNLSGLERGAARGDVKALATFGYFFQVWHLGILGDIYAGAALQAGNVWDGVSETSFANLRYSGTLFIGADTRLSPVYFAVGLAEEGEHAFYLFIGPAF